MPARHRVRRDSPRLGGDGCERGCAAGQAVCGADSAPRVPAGPPPDGVSPSSFAGTGKNVVRSPKKRSLVAAEAVAVQEMTSEQQQRQATAATPGDIICGVPPPRGCPVTMAPQEERPRIYTNKEVQNITTEELDQQTCTPDAMAEIQKNFDAMFKVGYVATTSDSDDQTATEDDEVEDDAAPEAADEEDERAVDKRWRRG